MSLKSRTERNIAFLDARIVKLENEVNNLKALRFKYQGMLMMSNKVLVPVAKELGLKIKLIQLHKEYYKKVKK